MRVVLDTNIVVSGYLTPTGLAAKLLARWREDASEVLVSEETLDELHEVLLRPAIQARHQLTDTEVQHAVDGFRQFATVVDPLEEFHVSADPDDDKFLDCAVGGGADFIVTRDPHLLDIKSFKGVRILSPAALLAALDTQDDR